MRVSPKALQYVIYDNACAVARMIRKRAVLCPPWHRLRALLWVIDRLHLQYHKARQDPASGWYAAGANPADYPQLAGIDTEAAEQLFSVANRWQAGLLLR